MSPLAVTAITNFILASEVFLFAGALLGRMTRFDSSFGFWALAMLSLGVGALLSLWRQFPKIGWIGAPFCLYGLFADTVLSGK